MVEQEELIKVLLPLNLCDIPVQWVDHVFQSGLPLRHLEESVGDPSWTPDTQALLRACRAMSRWVDDENNSDSESNRSEFWKLVAANNTREDLQVNQGAIHRRLVTLLLWLMEQSNGEIHQLVKAMIAARLYLTWLQLSGCSAYGVFISLVYRQALGVLRTWSEVAMEKVLGDARKSQDVRFPDDKKIDQYGITLLETLVRFVNVYSLDGLSDAIPQSIETIVSIFRNIIMCGNKAFGGQTDAMKSHCQTLLEGLLNERNGDCSRTLGLIYKRQLPLICMTERMNLKDQVMLNGKSKLSVQVHNAATSLVVRLQTYISTQTDGVETNLLALIENLCIQVPEKAEARNLMLKAVELLLTTDMYPSTSIRETFAQFLIKYSRNDKSLWRLFATQLATDLLRHPMFRNSLTTLMKLLIDRSNDKVSAVRAKAISGLSSNLLFGLRPKESDAAAIEFGQRLQSYFNEATQDKEKSSYSLTGLLDIFRARLHDEKTFVRRAAVQALEMILMLDNTSATLSSIDVSALHAQCADKSVMVRCQALNTLSSLLLRFPENTELQKLWNFGVIPLSMDPERSVQTKALDAINRVILQRFIAWHQQESSDNSTLWTQVNHVDGAMARCLQKALRQLIIDGKLSSISLIRASSYAIDLTLKNQERRAEELPYWTLAWIILEELARSNQLLKAAESSGEDLQFVIQCWVIVTEKYGFHEFPAGGCRILRVISELASVIEASDAAQIAENLSTALGNFSLPMSMIGNAVLTLHTICISKAPCIDVGEEISSACFIKILNLCESHMTDFVMGTSGDLSSNQDIQMLKRKLFTLGEISMIGFDKNGDQNKISMLQVPQQAESLVQSLLAPRISPLGSSGSSTSYAIPDSIRAVAFVTLGKLCLLNQELAKQCIPMFIRELHTSSVEQIRSNVLLILGDLCIRYTSLIDLYIPSMASCMSDRSSVVRRHAILLVSQLILQDYVKWRGDLLSYFLIPIVDQVEDVRTLAEYVLSVPLLHKNPQLFTNNFVNTVFVLTKFRCTEESRGGIDLSGDANAEKRQIIYEFLLQRQQDEQKLQISAKLVSDVLEKVADGKFERADALVIDVLGILSSAAIKISHTKDDSVDDENLAVDAKDEATVTAAKAESQLARAKGKLLAKISKKNFLENVVPVVIALKQKLEKLKSPVLRHLMLYLKELFKDDQSAIQDILSADPQLARELEYDLRRFEEADNVAEADVSESQLKTPRKMATPLSRNRAESCYKTPQKIDLMRIATSTPRLRSTAPGSISRHALTPIGLMRTVPEREKVMEENIVPSTVVITPRNISREKWNVSVPSAEDLNIATELGEKLNVDENDTKSKRHKPEPAVEIPTKKRTANETSTRSKRSKKRLPAR